MLTYALQDEYLARPSIRPSPRSAARPFSSIVVAESTHIAKLTAPTTANGFTAPKQRGPSR